MTGVRAAAGALLLGLTLAVVPVVVPAPSRAATTDQQGRVLELVREGRILPLGRRTASISGDVRTTQTPEQVQVELASDVLFAFDSAALTPEAAGRAQELATRVAAEATGPVLVVGHTDSVGDGAYNQTLSEQRATAVAQALQALAPADYRASGAGESEPVAPEQLEDGSDDPAGRQLNRRVTITFPTAP